MHRTPKTLHKTPEASLRIWGGGTYEARQNTTFPSHCHSVWELVYYRSGTVDCVMAGHKYPGHGGLLWLTPPGVYHSETGLTAYSNYFITLDLLERRGRPAFLEDDANRSLGRICEGIVLECNSRARQRSRMLMLLAEQLTCQLDRASRAKILPHPAKIVARAERVIEEKCGRALTIRSVAHEVHASESALRSYFQSVRGCSPREHLQQVRLNKAIRLLRTSTLKLDSIAELCGYDSASHLTRSVKKFTRRTPGKLRALS